jgi:hypothetical protein
MFRVPSNSNGDSNSSNQTYEGPNGMTATIITNDDGDKVIKVIDDNDNMVEYVGEQANESVDDMTNSPMNEPHTSFNNEDSNERGGNNKTNTSSNKYDDNSNKYDGASNSDNSYDAYLPPGIPKSEISPGDEDLYILKSQVVPPVCPACPAYGPTAMLAKANSASNSETTDSTTTDPNEEGDGSSGKYPPCPACDRCPEPSYACKMVPNYSNFNSGTMPVPVLSAFSTFGM